VLSQLAYNYEGSGVCERRCVLIIGGAAACASMLWALGERDCSSVLAALDGARCGARLHGTGVSSVAECVTWRLLHPLIVGRVDYGEGAFDHSSCARGWQLCRVGDWGKCCTLFLARSALQGCLAVVGLAGAPVHSLTALRACGCAACLWPHPAAVQARCLWQAG
jgi:hypothetical protein